MLEAVAEVVLHGVAGATGHGLLWAVSLGRWQVTNGRDDLAMIVGLAAWALAVVGALLLFLR